ncbi:MAG: DUF4058 family protein [Phaeodactylibacter sp.]|nr:DUF4058 family protein [Phaeodactylibacter sp.]
MKSPFPGMDPYLEDYLWPDVHQRLAAVICELLGPQISPAYVARMNLYTVNDTSPEEDVGIMYPDVEVLKRKAEEPAEEYAADTPPTTPVTISIPATRTVEVRIPVVEIRNRKKNQLITAIEILSPVNKRKPGLQPYIEKRERLHASGVHLLEIDLIRRGQRPFIHPYLPKSHYLITLTRAGTGNTDAWAFNVKDSLPVVPVPLKAPDEDVVLDLGKALGLAYSRGLYHLSVNYREEPPPPDFDEEARAWMRELLKEQDEG